MHPDARAQSSTPNPWYRQDPFLYQKVGRISYQSIRMKTGIGLKYYHIHFWTVVRWMDLQWSKYIFVHPKTITTIHIFWLCITTALCKRDEIPLITRWGHVSCDEAFDIWTYQIMPIWYCYSLHCSNDNQGRWRMFIAYYKYAYEQGFQFLWFGTSRFYLYPGGLRFWHCAIIR